MVKFVTVGNMTIDDILLPDGRSASSQCGGNCLYAAVGARIWSESVGIVSLVGAEFPRAWLDAVRAAGIDIQGIATMPQPHGMRAGLAYRADGERAMLQDGGLGRDEYDKYPHEWQEWLDCSPSAEHVPPAYADAVGIHFAPVPVQAHEALVPTMRRPGRRLTLDSPWWAGATGQYEPRLELLGTIDALLPSEHDVRVFARAVMDPAAVALFSAAKLFEQPHANGVPQELEEWAHEQYFLTRPGATHIFVIVPPGRSRDRALEQMRGARDMGATVVAVCDEGDAEVRAAADLAFPIQGSLPEEFSPLTYIVPNQLFATHLHTVRGRPPLESPYDVDRLRDVNYRQIFQSSIPDGEG